VNNFPLEHLHGFAKSCTKSKSRRLILMVCTAAALIAPASSFAQLSGEVTTPAQPPAISASESANFEFPSCPIEALRAAYRSLLTEEDTFNVLAVEEQVLLVCRERQTLILAYKSGVKEIASGLSEMASQKQDLIEGFGDLDVVLDQVRTAKLELADVNAKIEQAALNLREGANVEQEAEGLGFEPDGVATIPSDIAQSPANLEGCTQRYSLLAVGKIKGRPYATLADEQRGTSLNAFVGETLPYGVKIKSIRGTKVTVSTDTSSHVLPVASDGWHLKQGSDAATDGLIWYPIDPAQTPSQTTQKAVDVKVFTGFEVD